MVLNGARARELCGGNAAAYWSMRNRLKRLLGDPILSYSDEEMFLYRL